MIRYAPFLSFAFLPASTGVVLSQAGKSTERQIAEAVSALPAALRDGATVLGHTASGSLVTVRMGTNGMICIADDPTNERWHVACYHEALEPFMARGRELRQEGITGEARDSIRRAEIEGGKLLLPRQPMALYSWFGTEESFNPQTGNAERASGLHVVYMPYATGESTGFSTTPSRESPWLMNPGLPWAHLMIARSAEPPDSSN